MTTNLAKAVNESKRLLFTVTTGRSGTAFLAEMLNRLPGVTAVHEEPPDFVDYMRSVQTDPSVAIDFLVNKKLPEILRSKDSIYIETSHLFCKGFLEPLLELGVVPDLILLERNPREVAKSLWQLGTIPSRTENGLRYLLKPDDPVFLQLTGWEDLNDYQLCYWYCLEIAERCNRFARMVESAGGRAVSAGFTDIQHYSGLVKLQESLKLPSFSLVDKTRLSLSKPKPVNSKADRKKSWDLAEAVEELEKEVSSRIVKRPT